MFITLPLSLASIPLPGKLWFLYPNGINLVTVAVAISISAMQLFSWQVAHAFCEFSETAMYSGYKSSATVELRKNTPPCCMRPVILILLSIA